MNSEGYSDTSEMQDIVGASVNSEGYSDTSEMQDIVGASVNSGIQ